MELLGQAVALHINGRRLSHVPNSHDCIVRAKETATHSPDVGSGWFSDQNPEYWDTKAPDADSNVLVRRSSSDARPNQYLSESRLFGSAAAAIDSVMLFSV